MRAVHMENGLQKEVFQCPSDGRLEYAAGFVPLEAMGHADHVHTDLQVAQPMTGLELVH